MRVKNINGTSDNSCNCDSWLTHWKKFSKKSDSLVCSEISCSDKPIVGAHVQKDSPADMNWYIIPLCKLHNSRRGEIIVVKESTIFVSANVKATCGR